MANFCSKCGRRLERGANACSFCGHVITEYEPIPYKEDKTFGEIFFRSRGRLNRWRYFKRSMLLLLVEVVLVIALIAAFMEPLEGNISDVGIILIAIVTVVFLPAYYMLSIRRLHDLNKSGWFCLLMLVPFVQSIFSFYLLLAPGTVGPNEYGADPLEDQW